ncbi:MAG: antibiotic biosynthesis monooxygenase [Alphaproteobacteria bacterium]|nr:antibiotic biosynthesis monooxygenase [Alphaproteobacteria bacterium]MBF0250873.1 antibiotic biosynthesis monooxygenase [Alphaproteobacteria bacterium]
MPVTLVHVTVKPDRIDDFIAACKANHQGSIQEPGNRRFDVLQNEAEPTKFVLYEWFDGDADIAAHKQTDHYNTWARTVQDMMAEPRYAVRHVGLFPKG